MLAACSWEEVRETASRTARNVCADTSSCTVYEEGEPVKTGRPRSVGHEALNAREASAQGPTGSRHSRFSSML